MTKDEEMKQEILHNLKVSVFLGSLFLFFLMIVGFVHALPDDPYSEVVSENVKDWVIPERYQGSLHKECRGDPLPEGARDSSLLNHMLDGVHVHCFTEYTFCNAGDTDTSLLTKEGLDYGYVDRFDKPKAMMMFMKVNRTLDYSQFNKTDNSTYYVKKEFEFLEPFDRNRNLKPGACVTGYLNTIKNSNETVEHYVNYSKKFFDPLWLPAPDALNLSMYWGPNGTNSPVSDYSGNGRTGALKGGTFSNSSTSLSSNGSFDAWGWNESEYGNITISNGSLQSHIGSNTTQWSFGLVFNTTDSLSATIFASNEITSTTKYYRLVAENNNRLDCSSSGNCIMSKTLNDGKFHLAVCTFNPVSRRHLGYFDGQLACNASLNQDTQTTDGTGLISGGSIKNQFGGQARWNGTIKEVRVYQSQLTPQQVKAWWEGLGRAPNLTKSIEFNQTNYTAAQNIFINFTYTSLDTGVVANNIEYGNVSVEWFVNGILKNTTRFNLVQNGSLLNATLTSTQGQYSTNDNVTYNVTAIDQRNKNASPSLTNTTQILNNPPSFDQNMEDVSILVNTMFYRQVNCTDPDNSSITYSNNQTQLFNISPSTGVINDTPIPGEENNYTVVITCSDGSQISQQFDYQINGTPNQVDLKGFIANTTSFETSNQTFYLNISYNTSSRNLSGGSFIFGQSTYAIFLVTQSQEGSTEYNLSLWRANAITSLTVNNNTATTFQFNITEYNGSNNSRFYNSTQNLTFSYIVSALTLNPTAIETSTQPIIVNISKQADGLASNFSVNIEYNLTNRSAYQLSNSSTRDAWQINTSSTLIDTLNLTFEVFAYFNVSFNGVTVNRTIANSTQLINQMLLNNCTSGSETTIPALNYSLLNETSSASVVGTSEMYFETFVKSKDLNRSFSFDFSNHSSPQLCLYPRGGLFNISVGTISYSAPLYSERFFNHNNTAISNASHLFNLYLLSDALTSTISIQVIDQFNQNIPGTIIKAYKYDLASDTYTLVDSDTTAINGIAIMKIEGNETYQFEFYVDGELKKTETFQVTSDFYTIKILLGSIVSLNAYQSVTQVSNTLTCDNTTNVVSLTWDDDSDVTDQVCLNVYNVSVGLSLLNQSCSNNATGSLSFSNYSNTSTYLGVAVADSTEDSNKYILDRCFLNLNNDSTGIPFGLGGALLALVLMGTVVLMGRGNVPLSLALMIPAIAFVWIMRLIPLTYTGGIALMAMILILYLGMRDN